MKTIVLIPTKNEEWILENTLKNITPHVDHVIIADQQSTDRTREICASFDNVIVIDNPHIGHSNKVRWLLIEEARKLGAHNLIICIDADEVICPKGITLMRTFAKTKSAVPGDVFKLRWVQLYKSTDRYMEEGAWKNNYKNIAFIDNPGVNEYKKDVVINDHTSRVPDTNIRSTVLIDSPLLHFLFVAWKRNQIKQAWYRCNELVAGQRNAKRINNMYRVTLIPEHVRTYPINPLWVEGLDLPKHLENITSDWHESEIKNLFQKHGIEFFEDLQIWHIPELKEMFIKEIGRNPQSKTFPRWLVVLNEVRHTIKKIFR
jgi:glycosyltransferase involved in cell wall biosynthesis